MRHLHRNFAFLAILVLLAGCAESPVKVAGTPELKAQALYAEYVLSEEAAARLIQDARVPDNVKLAIQSGHRSVNPIVEEIERQRLAIEKLKVEKPEDVAAAILALNDLLLAAGPIVKSFNPGSQP